MNTCDILRHAERSETSSIAANKAVARRVLEEIFPANDVGALREVIDEEFVNHEVRPVRHQA